MEIIKEPLLKDMFGYKRVLGLAGKQNSGKTNNLLFLIKDFRDHNQKNNIYIYGFNVKCLKWLSQFNNIYEVSSLDQLSDKKNSLIIFDEFQKLRLNDRRYRGLLNKFIDFIYHNNNWVVLSSPSIREFNFVIGGKIEGWLLKTLNFSNLINGSQLKEAVSNYCGRYKVLNNIEIGKDEILVINEDYEKIVKTEYIEEVDTKKEFNSIF
jgi:hypothetical protein